MGKRLLVIALLLTAGVALAALVWWPRQSGDGEGVLTLYGNVDIREVRLGFRVGGRLESVTREEGDRVAPGDVLARLDAEPYRQALAAAEAQAEAAAANLAKQRAGSRPQEIQQARAEVRAAEAAAGDAAVELERQRSLLARGATTERTLDAAAARARETAARLEAAREALALAEEGFRSEDIRAAEAELARARAEAAQARTRLGDTELAAPSAGTILSRIREPGAVLAPGEPVYSLSLDRPVWIRAYVDEPDLGRVRPGMRALVATDSRDEPYRGHVGFISPQAEFTPKNVATERLRTDLVYRLRVVVEEPDEGLRQGMPVTVVLHPAEPEP